MWILMGILALIGALIFGPMGVYIGLGLGFATFQFYNDWLRRKNEREFIDRLNAFINAPKPISILDLFPVIDLLQDCLLKKDPQWTPEKLRFIKDYFKKYVHTFEDESVLKLRIQRKDRPPFNFTCEEVLKLHLNINQMAQLFRSCCEALNPTEWSDQEYINLLTHLGESLQINPTLCSAIINDVLRTKYGQSYQEFTDAQNLKQSTYNRNNQQHQQQQKRRKQGYSRNFSPKFNTYGEEAWALQLLGLSQHCTDADITKAFRKKISAYHPDRHPNADERTLETLNKKTMELVRARDLLTDAYN